MRFEFRITNVRKEALSAMKKAVLAVKILNDFG
jgi:hypothetical protein